MAKGSLLQNAKVLLRIFGKARKSIIKLKLENIQLKKELADLRLKNAFNITDLKTYKWTRNKYKDYINKLN